jgi:hypothetical protein
MPQPPIPTTIGEFHFPPGWRVALKECNFSDSTSVKWAGTNSCLHDFYGREGGDKIYLLLLVWKPESKVGYPQFALYKNEANPKGFLDKKLSTVVFADNLNEFVSAKTTMYWEVSKKEAASLCHYYESFGDSDNICTASP